MAGPLKALPSTAALVVKDRCALSILCPYEQSVDGFL